MKEIKFTVDKSHKMWYCQSVPRNPSHKGVKYEKILFQPKTSHLHNNLGHQAYVQEASDQNCICTSGCIIPTWCTDDFVFRNGTIRRIKLLYFTSMRGEN